MTFADQLVELRLRRGLSQEELALASGVSVRTISNLERAVTSPQRGTVRALAIGLGLDSAEQSTFEAAARQAATEPNRAAPPGSANLPAAVTSIVGREEDLATVARLVLRGPQRLVAITGPGGVGKSRLALEVAWRVADRFERVDAIDLSALRDRDEALVALASTVGVPATAPATAASVAARIGDVAWLLLVDSLEHVPGVPDDLGYLLDRCPRLRVLATTRTRQDDGVPLAPLPLPEGPDADSPRALGRNPAVRLLVERARAVRPGFDISEENGPALAALCRRLDGLPLAIELAAGQLRTRDAAEIEEELAVRATTLRADVIDLPGRHRTLRDTVEWSTDRLSDTDRQRFATLGSFRGQVPATVWADVLRGAGLTPDGLDATLTRLASTSLVTVAHRAGQPSVGMLDTIREVAEDLLADSDLDRRCRSAHAQHMLSLVRMGDAEAVESNLDNVRAALAFATAREPELFDRAVVTALADHLVGRSRFAEAHRVLAGIATAVVDGGHDRTCLRTALLRAGVAANMNGDPRPALELAQRALREAEAASDVDHQIAALNLIGAAHKALGELDAAYQAYSECHDASVAIGNSRYITVALNNLGTVAHDRGAYQQALRHYERSLQLKRDLNDPRGMATALVNLGGLYKDLGAHAEARTHLLAAEHLFRELLEPYGLAFTLGTLAEAHLGLGDHEAAEHAAREAAAIGAEIDHGQTQGMAALALGDLARARGLTDVAEAHYRDGLGQVIELVERIRLLERLAAVQADQDPAEAAALLQRAEEIRRLRQYATPPVDRPLAEATRRRLDHRS